MDGLTDYTERMQTWSNAQTIERIGMLPPTESDLEIAHNIDIPENIAIIPPGTVIVCEGEWRITQTWPNDVWEIIQETNAPDGHSIRGPNQDGYYDSTGEYWPDAHKYIASDTDEVLKLIDDTLRR